MAAGLFTMLIASAQAPAAPAPAVQPAQLRAGSIGLGDYPASALKLRAEGTTEISILIGLDGRTVQCAVTQLSGNFALDSTSCSLAQRRFRFRPARDAAGNPTFERRTQRVVWRLPDEAPAAPAKESVPG